METSETIGTKINMQDNFINKDFVQIKTLSYRCSWALLILIWFGVIQATFILLR